MKVSARARAHARHVLTSRRQKPYYMHLLHNSAFAWALLHLLHDHVCLACCAVYPGTKVKTIELDSFRLMHRASFSHRNVRTYVVVVYVPGSIRCAEVEQEVCEHDLTARAVRIMRAAGPARHKSAAGAP